MMDPVALSPIHRLWTTRFTGSGDHGIFVAPWTVPSTNASPDPDEIAGALIRTAADPGDTPTVLGHLLSVHRKCLWAAKETDPVTARTHYQDALADCETALELVHNSTGEPRTSLSAWALGVHTLILAQRAMPDALESRKLATHALKYLSQARDPLCSGAQSDRLAALALIEETEQLTTRMASLPHRVRRALDHARAQIEVHENLIKLHLADVHEMHRSSFRATLAWVAANAALVATLPLNAIYLTWVPWSLPFLLALGALWWWTWIRPYRDGLFWFTWLGARHSQAIGRFQAAFDCLPDPGRDFTEETRPILVAGRRDRDRLNQFYLFTMPKQLDTMAEAEQIVRAGGTLLAGTWMSELDDRHPWPLADVTPVAHQMLPHTIRVWHGTSEH